MTQAALNAPGNRANPSPGGIAALRYDVHPLAASVALAAYLLLTANVAWVQAAWRASGGSWGFTLAASAMVLAWLAAASAALLPRCGAVAWAGSCAAVAVGASHLQRSTGAVLDPSMLRNVWHTDWHEAQELLSAAFLIQLIVCAALPAWMLRRVALRPWGRTPLRAIAMRVACALALLLAGLACAFCVMQPFASWMRNDKTARYLITPINVVWSSAVALTQDAQAAARPREVVGADAKAGATWAQRKRPMVVLVVVGETARARNWGLNLAQYAQARDTTPQLARADVVNFPKVESCGTSTEESVPCMFSLLGRTHYDEKAIRRQESVLHVMARAGVRVHWRDNQSGCKGTCIGLPTETVDESKARGLCPGGRCWDEALVADLGERLQKAQGTQVWVLHQIGSHGPAYHRRYPRAFAHFQPECLHDDLQRCSLQEIANSYDNSLRYTDHVLARAVAQLKAQADQVDSALIYMSDHGESLGEKGLFLHGMPRAIAPREQLQVPMVAWTSPGMDAARGFPKGCLRQALTAAAGTEGSHDWLAHTLLGLVDVQTSSRDAARDLTQHCANWAAS